jgi:hypothetical protein
MRAFCRFAGSILSAGIVLAGASALAQTNRPIYTDNLVNGFGAGSSGLSYNIANTNTVDVTNAVHSGSYSISATITASGGYLSFSHGGFNSAPYGSVQFWINGGTNGGQNLKVYGLLNGGTQTAYVLQKLPTNVWTNVIVTLSALGCSNKNNFSGFRIQDNSGGAQPVFYVDDVYIGALPAPPVVHLSILASQTNRMADARWFGVNAETWDANLGNGATLPALTNAGILNLRWPGGSGADTHNWASDISEEQTFNHIATNLGPGAQAFITVNYGSGDSNMAAGYVLFNNITNHCHYKYWEVGNECYGGWENDTNLPAHNAYTYAVKAATYITAMKAADPTIKVGVVSSPGDNSYVNGNTNGATNLSTHAVVYGWTPVVLATLRNAGVQPDFLIHHVYPQYTAEPLPASPPPPAQADSDMFLLQSTSNWAGDAATLRQEIQQYFGPAGTNIEICCTENNSDSSNGGKQLSSLVNGLYEADTLAQLMQTEINCYLWWDLRNGEGSNGDEDPSLYGWRQYGDEGLISGATGYNPVYYAMKMMQYFARPGSAIVKASSDYLLLSVYAARQTNGTLSVLVINKDPVANFNGQLNFTGFAPLTNAVSRTYGEFQDNATSSNLSAALQDIAATNITTASNLLNYSFPPYSLTVLTFASTASLPAFVQQPTNQTAVAGGPATFSVTASGPLPLAYAWYRNGARIAGAGTNTYTTNNVQVTDSGSQFTCVITNAFGSVSSSNATLTVAAAPLAQNGGLELGTFAGWTFPQKAGTNISASQPYVHSGVYGAKLGESGSASLNYMDQTVSTIVGQTYQISCWLYCDGTTPNEFSIVWNGATLYDQQNMGNTGWTNLQAQGPATTGLTTLGFGFRNDSSYFGLDDVAVYPVPQFKTMTLTNGTISLNWTAQAGRTYQLQYTTNLAQSQWSNWGATLFTTSNSVTSTDATTAPQGRYYRVVLQP